MDHAILDDFYNRHSANTVSEKILAHEKSDGGPSAVHYSGVAATDEMVLSALEWVYTVEHGISDGEIS